MVVLCVFILLCVSNGVVLNFFSNYYYEFGYGFVVFLCRCNLNRLLLFYECSALSYSRLELLIFLEISSGIIFLLFSKCRVFGRVYLDLSYDINI